MDEATRQFAVFALGLMMLIVSVIPIAFVINMTDEGKQSARWIWIACLIWLALWVVPILVRIWISFVMGA